MPNYIAMGAGIYGKDESYINFLQEKCGVQSCWIVKGAAIANRLDVLDHYLQTIKRTEENCDYLKERLRKFQIQGIAMSGNTKVLLEHYGKRIQRWSFWDKMVIKDLFPYLILTGDIPALTNLCANENIIANLNEDSMLVMAGYAGHLEISVLLLKKFFHFVDAEDCFMEGLGRGGRVRLFQKISEKMPKWIVGSIKTSFRAVLFRSNPQIKFKPDLFLQVIKIAYLEEIETLSSCIELLCKHKNNKTSLLLEKTMSFNKYGSLKRLIMMLSLDHYQFAKEALLLHQFSFIKEEYFEKFITVFEHYMRTRPVGVYYHFFDIPEYDISNFINKCSSIRRLMSIYNFDYDEALFYFKNKSLVYYLPALPLAYNQSNLINLGFPNEMLDLILFFLFKESPEIIAGVINKYIIFVHRQLLVYDLTDYLNLNWISHRAQAKEMKKEVENTRSLEEIDNLTREKLGFFNKKITNKSAFYSLLERANERLHPN